MKEAKRVTGLLALMSVVALGAASVASAVVLDPGTRDARIQVSYSDLDLTSSAGVVTLYSRLKAASKQACGPTNVQEAGSVQRLQQNKACYADLLSRAVEKVGNDSLSAIHNS